MTFIQITYQEWLIHFRLVIKPGTSDQVEFDSHYDAEFLRTRPEFTIWTMVSCPDGDWVIQNGFWRINRMAHYVTEVAYDPANEYNVE